MNSVQPNSIRKLSQSQAFLNRTGLVTQAGGGHRIKIRQTPNYSLDQPLAFSGRKGSHPDASKGFQSFLTPKDNLSTMPSTIPASPSPDLMRGPNKPKTQSGGHLLFSPKLGKTSNFFRPSSRLENISPPNFASQRLQRSPLEDWDSGEDGTMVSLASPKEVDFTSEIFITRLLHKFLGPARERVTTTIFIGRIPRTVSIRYAQQILQTLADALRSIKAMKLKKYHELDDMDRPDVMLGKFGNAINEITELCQNAINDRAYKNLLDKHIKKMVAVAQQTGNVELLLCCKYIQGKVLMARCDFREAISEFRHFKDICVGQKVYGRRVEAYKMLGKCYQGLKYHKTALVYFTKFLYVAWEIDSAKDEILAYDYIGIQYYYMGKLEKAEFFHNKMVGGKLEPKNSRLRQIGIVKIRLNKDHGHTFANGKKGYDFDPDFEMGMGWDKGIEDDGNHDEAGGEISYRDEGFEPPVSNLEEEIENRRTMERLKRNQISLLKLKEPPKVTLKAIPGFMKAKVGLVKMMDGKTRKQKTPFFGKSPGEAEDELVQNKIALTKPIRNGTANSFFTGKPNEQIFTSHLSRNRGLKNFAYLKYASYEQNDENNELDSKSCEQIRKVLEKFKANMEAIKESLRGAYPGLI